MNIKVEVQRFLLLALITYLTITLILAVGVVLMLLLYQFQKTGVALDEKTFSVNLFLLIVWTSIKWILPLSLILAANLEYQHLKAYKRLGIISNSVNTALETELTLPLALEEAFACCEKSLEGLVSEKVVCGVAYKQQYEIVFSDLAGGLLEVKTHFVSDLKSSDMADFITGRRKKAKGETITFKLNALENGNTSVHIKSATKLLLGLTDFGQNYVNIATLQKFFGMIPHSAVCHSRLRGNDKAKHHKQSKISVSNLSSLSWGAFRLF